MIEGYICLLTDDGSPLTVKLAQFLVEQGWKVVVLSFPESIIKEGLPLPRGINRVVLADISEEHLKQKLGAIAKNYGAIGAFIHLSPLTTTTSTAKAILKQVFLIAKYLQKSLNAAAKQGRSWFVTVSRLDGQLGVGEKTNFNPINGGLFGLTKTLNLEWSKVFCRAIDISPNLETGTAARSIIAELYDPNCLIAEVGYSSQGRVTLIGKDYPIADQKNPSKSEISRDSVLLVSGGGRGITSQCAIKLAEYYQCKFILLGRSELNDEPEWSKNCFNEIELKKRAFSALNSQGFKPKPTQINKLVKGILATREIQSTLQRIKQLGGQAEYLTVDITDSVNLPKQLSPIVNKLGEISGIIHGAGVLADKLIENKTEQDFERVYSTKIEGLENLLNCVNSEQLKHLIFFSSAAGFYDNVGQSDYAIANEILNKFAHQFKHQYPDCQVVSFNWGPWESGMVTPELKEVFAQRGIDVIPIDVGTKVFVNQIIKGNPDRVQILVGSGLINPTVELESELKTYRIRKKLTLEANPFLQEHVIGNHAVLPTVFANVWLANTAEQIYLGYKFFSCENFKVLKGIVFDETLADEYILDIKELTKIPNQEIELSATIWSESKQGKPRYHYQGNFKLLKQIPERPIYENFDNQQDDKLINLSPYQDGTLFHGVSFQGVKRVLNSKNKLIANISLHDEKGNIYSRFFGAEVTISKQLNHLFTPANIKLTEKQGDTGINPAFEQDIKLANLTSFWRKYLGVRHPVAEALHTALYNRFVGQIILEDTQDFYSLDKQPRLYLANHQVEIESNLFIFAVSALSNSLINAVAKIEHQQSWMSELSQQIYSYPQVNNIELTFYFNRKTQSSMLELLNTIKRVIIEQKKSLLVHIEGTRSLSCRQPVKNLSAVFVDLAMELNLPIIPVKFIGGLPVKPLKTRLHFPFGYTYQNYNLGKAICPRSLRKLGNLERKELILERLNHLGGLPEKMLPHTYDRDFDREVRFWIEKTGVSEVYAVLYKVLEKIPDPPEEIATLVTGIQQGKIQVNDTPEGHWLGEFGKWLVKN